MPDNLPGYWTDPLSPPSASVHPQETTLKSTLPPSYRTHLKSFDHDQLIAAQETILYLHPDPEDPIRRNFLACRTGAWFVRHKITGEVRVHSRACKNRFCPFCSHAKAARISHNVHDWVKTLDRPKLLTLTLQHSTAPLDVQLRALGDHFRNWRNREPMKHGIRGGLWFLQITFNHDDCTWHPHLHIIIDADWIPQKLLSDRWLKVTKTSSVVDVRQIRSAEKAARYVSRYVARPGSIIDLPVDYRAEMYFAFAGRRSCGSFGTARKAKIMDREPFDRTLWQSVGSWSTVVTLSPWNKSSKAILAAWQLRRPLPEGISLNYLDRCIEDEGFQAESPRKKQLNFECPEWT